MLTLSLPPQSLSISNLQHQNIEPFSPNNLKEPVIVSYSSFINFKIYQSPHNFNCIVAENLSNNRTPFSIKPIYKTIFVKQFSSICKMKLKELIRKLTLFQNIPQISTDKISPTLENESYLFQSRVQLKNGSTKIEFIQKQTNIKLMSMGSAYFIKVFLLFLKEISGPLKSLLERVGTLKPSFSEKLKSNKKIEKSKSLLRKILNQQKTEETQNSKEKKIMEEQQKSHGVFQFFFVIRQEQLNEDELIYKSGGYFNIQKRKYVVTKQQEDSENTSAKTFAQKKLSKRKRPNTIYNYQGKIPKELKLLQCLNTATLQELSHFAKYYILNQSTRADFSNQQMEDESQQFSKKTPSTVSQDEIFRHLTDAIYMDFYDENLEQYLARKGKLDIFEILSLLKQIFQSVITLHKFGIVHRDLKPANFMIEIMPDGTVKTKLIDFGESTHVSFNFQNSQILGFSTQYAPIQCTYPCKQGFNSKQIDLWSVGVLVYKLTTNRMPLNYSKCFKSDIKHEWPTSLNFFIIQYVKGRWSVIEQTLVVMALSLMKVNPQERMDLKTGLKILEQVQIMAFQFSQQQMLNKR